MIYGIGTDIVAVKRLAGVLERHGESFLDRVLAPEERTELPEFAEARARFLARRWAAKEAFAKAFRTGVRGVVSLAAVRVTHEESGAPVLTFSDELAKIMTQRHLKSHLSISDEHDYAVAFVVIEQDLSGEPR
jgi:holo-[acyl-carrier protein] synthase